MDHVIYTAMGGAKHALENQAIVSNNIANVSTSGFKAQLSAMRAVPVNGDTEQTRHWWSPRPWSGYDSGAAELHRPSDGCGA